jgi:aminomethyltransferase
MSNNPTKLKSTPLIEKHEALGAKMAPFAGYLMPISYTTLSEEHQAVRNKAGLFDVSHMGEFVVYGPEALDLVQKVTSNNAARLLPGQAQYSCLPNAKGGIIDDLLVYRLHDINGMHAFLLVVNASNIDKDWAWIQSQNDFNLTMENRSDETGLLALQGPLATKILQKLTDRDVSKIPFYHFASGTVAGIEDVIISATGYTGSGGFELYAKNENIGKLWDAIMEVGQDDGLLPVGLGARDTLRLEMGYCLYGNDIDDSTSPLEAGLGWITKLKKGDFTGKAHIEKLKEEGISKRLVGFKVDGRRVPRQGYPILDRDENPVGRVTSGTLSPSLGIPIGMGYVPVEMKAEDTVLGIQAGKKVIPAKVCKLPFYQIEDGK